MLYYYYITTMQIINIYFKLLTSFKMYMLKSQFQIFGNIGNIHEDVLKKMRT